MYKIINKFNEKSDNELNEIDEYDHLSVESIKDDPRNSRQKKNCAHQPMLDTSDKPAGTHINSNRN